MAGVPDKIKTWQMVQPTSFDRETKKVTPGKIEKNRITSYNVCYTKLLRTFVQAPELNFHRFGYGFSDLLVDDFIGHF